MNFNTDKKKFQEKLFHNAVLKKSCSRILISPDFDRQYFKLCDFEFHTINSNKTNERDRDVNEILIFQFKRF